jgi:hypothetical protein
MKFTRFLLLLALLSIPQFAFGNDVNSLINEVVKKYSAEGYTEYTRIEIGSTAYLVKGKSSKVLQTKKIKARGGICGDYATVWVIYSDRQMRVEAESAGSIWKFSGGSWKQIARMSAGDWECKDVKSIPKSVRKCLAAEQCY